MGHVQETSTTTRTRPRTSTPTRPGPATPMRPGTPVASNAIRPPGSRTLVAAVCGLLVACAVLATPIPSAPAENQAIPDWYLRDIEDKTRDGGVWIADNSAYREEDGGIDAFGIEWRAGIGGKSMVGRLFSLRDGQELATHWEFRMFWHPVDREAMAYQFGVDGTVGWGVATPGPDESSSIIEQTFASPDGTVTRVRHETRTEGDRDIGHSFNWVDGEWQPRRTYTWVLRR